MRKLWTGLTVGAMCIALNFGLTSNAQAAELEVGDSSESAYQDMYGPPPPPPDYYDDYYPPPPPHGHRQPPPPPHRW